MKLGESCHEANSPIFGRYPNFLGMQCSLDLESEQLRSHPTWELAEYKPTDVRCGWCESVTPDPEDLHTAVCFKRRFVLSPEGLISLAVGGFTEHLDWLWRCGWILQKLQNAPAIIIPLLFMLNMLLLFHQNILSAQECGSEESLKPASMQNAAFKN